MRRLTIAFHAKLWSAWRYADNGPKKNHQKNTCIWGENKWIDFKLGRSGLLFWILKFLIDIELRNYSRATCEAVPKQEMKETENRLKNFGDRKKNSAYLRKQCLRSNLNWKKNLALELKGWRGCGRSSKSNVLPMLRKEMNCEVYTSLIFYSVIQM